MKPVHGIGVDSGADAGCGTTPARSRRSVGSALAAVVLFFVVFAALGTWQLQRRVWKRDLIARVDSRVHAPAVAPPPSSAWAGLTAARDAYRHVRLNGVFLDDRETLVQAVTELGAGAWVMTPLRLTDGTVVLVNRGFVPPALREPAMRSQAKTVRGLATVEGLLRISEPGGGFLRHNDPAAGRWTSRDVEAIARYRGLDHVAPYFVDADADGPIAWGGLPGSVPSSSAPVGGLTVIAFRNDHLLYACTWFSLALMTAVAGWWLRRDGLQTVSARSK